MAIEPSRPATNSAREEALPAPPTLVLGLGYVTDSVAQQNKGLGVCCERFEGWFGPVESALRRRDHHDGRLGSNRGIASIIGGHTSPTHSETTAKIQCSKTVKI